MKNEKKIIILISSIFGFLSEILIDVDHLRIFPIYIFHWLGTVFFITFFAIGFFIFTGGKEK